ncbi:MAG: CRISPR-associated helicase Cas3' [Candidatus Bathyarchaeia archaeon]
MNIKEIFRKLDREPYKHQIKASDILLEGEPVVIRAPCGSGKTEACIYPFLLDQCKVLPSRLIYSLPTRALVEDIARRVCVQLHDLNIGINVSRQHGANSKDPFFKEDIIFTTIDQTVGAYCCTPLSLPASLGNIPSGAAVSSLLCFDEVHTYDHELGLKTMLVLVSRAKKLGLPFVVMSATLPDSFIEWFREMGIAVIEASDKDVPKRSSRKVNLFWMSKKLNSDDVYNAFPEHSKIIVVCNTVDRAQRIYSELKSTTHKLFLLHSRFLPEDRVKIEKEMIKAFKDDGATCLITTQVCEVGLDVSCDMLLTELAPPDALIQRIGRCAREGGYGKVFVYDVEHNAPYHQNVMENCKEYIINKLNEKIIDWEQELLFVNQLLYEKFHAIINDKEGQGRILRDLGDAAFKGDKNKVEANVREILSANITIHDNPHDLRNCFWQMPWINVDVRVLRSAMKHHSLDIFQINYYSDDEGEFVYELIKVKKPDQLHPYENYVISSQSVRYDTRIGLIFGEKGVNFKPQVKRKDSREPIIYNLELWRCHVQNSLKAFNKIKDKELPLKLFSSLIERDYKICEGVLALAVALHDLGKLNRNWQKLFGIKNDSQEPLAHVGIDKNVKIKPSHAVISGFASQPLFEQILQKRSIYYPIILAISHHHYTRSERVNRYEIGWKEIILRILDELFSEYKIDIDAEKIIWSHSHSLLDQRFPDIERIKSYTIYAITSRLIRLSDRGAFNVNIKS